MTPSKYFLKLVLGMAIIYAVHFFLLHTQQVSYNWYHFNLFDCILFVLFFIGGAIVSPGFKGESEGFVMRFMVITTVQLLSVLSLIAAVLYTKQPQGRHLTYNIIGVFLALLIIQSALLVVVANKKAQEKK